jgi:hypothetical protein
VTAACLERGSVVRAELEDSNGFRSVCPAVVASATADIAAVRPAHVVAITTRLASPLPEDYVMLPLHRDGKVRSGLRRPSSVQLAARSGPGHNESHDAMASLRPAAAAGGRSLLRSADHSARRRRVVVARLVVERPELQRCYGGWVAGLHPAAWSEVEAMARATGKTLQIDLRQAIESLGLGHVLEQVGVRRVIEEVGIQRVLDEVGLQRVVDEVGLHRVLQEAKWIGFWHAAGPHGGRTLFQIVAEDKRPDLVLYDEILWAFKRLRQDTINAWRSEIARYQPAEVFVFCGSRVDRDGNDLNVDPSGRARGNVQSANAVLTHTHIGEILRVLKQFQFAEQSPLLKGTRVHSSSVRLWSTGRIRLRGETLSQLNAIEIRSGRLRSSVDRQNSSLDRTHWVRHSCHGLDELRFLLCYVSHRHM